MNKIICTTTINPPTEAIRLFDAMPGWTLVIAGDRRTPANPFYKPAGDASRFIYLSPECQEAYDKALSDAIGWNCIQRRNFAFLYAMKELKADVVATVDDDNIPISGWGEDLMVDRKIEDVNYWSPNIDAFDPLWVCAEGAGLWHRGFPLQLLAQRSKIRLDDFGGEHYAKEVRPDIQADLWNGAPDIDAICRMMHPEDFDLSNNDDVYPIASSKPSPFNSQNTFLSAGVMPHYFMFPGIGRMDDIWASYHVQAQGFKVIYGKPSVFQKRNPHDLTGDMKAEHLGYEHNHEIVRRIQTDKNAVLDFLPERAKTAFHLYQKHFQL